MNKVSVIIPNFNRAAIIGETIENMLSQTLPPHEVIIVDDGSTDDSIDVIRKYGNKVILIQQENAGPGAARNAGLKGATGEFIQFMDSDDLASLNKLEVQSKTLVANNADIVLGPWLKAWIAHKVMKLEDVVLQQKAPPSKRSDLLWFLTDWSMVFQQCLVRRSMLEKVGTYREDIKYFEDGDLFIRILLAGGKLVYEAQTLTFYRLNDFGKLTGEGQINIGRVHAQSTFYQDIINRAVTDTTLKDCINHPDFKLNVFKAFSDLKENNLLDNSDKYSELSRMAQKDGIKIKLNRFNKKAQAAISQKIRGHRWPNSYQAGGLSQYQKVLINELGFNLIK